MVPEIWPSAVSLLAFSGCLCVCVCGVSPDVPYLNGMLSTCPLVLFPYNIAYRERSLRARDCRPHDLFRTCVHQNARARTRALRDYYDSPFDACALVSCVSVQHVNMFS